MSSRLSRNAVPLQDNPSSPGTISMPVQPAWHVSPYGEPNKILYMSATYSAVAKQCIVTAGSMYCTAI